MTTKSFLATIFIAVLAISSVFSLSTPTPQNTQQTKPMNRLSFLQTTCASTAAVVFSGATPAFAKSKEVDPAVKGTKNDPNFEACLSQCIFECTKPKGEEQKSRKECIPECKKTCATTKEQLLTGQPVAK